MMKVLLEYLFISLAVITGWLSEKEVYQWESTKAHDKKKKKEY